MKKHSDEIPWTQEDEYWLRDNINKKTMPEIVAHMGRTENSINIKAHRLRLYRKKGGLNKEMVSRNILIEMLVQRIGNPENFRPTREFLDHIGIGQKRFWQLYRGEKNITVQEYRALSKEWKITLEDAFVMNQLKINLEFE
jgi:hypothetical protein